MHKVNKAVILAAGGGSRLYPLTKYFPKLVLPIFNKPLLIHHLEICSMLGIGDVYIVVSEKHIQTIKNIIESDDCFNINCYFVIQDFLGGTGHALLLLKEELRDSRFLLILGDEYYNDKDSFKEILNRSEENILGIIEYNDKNKIMSGCNIIMDEKEIKQLIEKPTIDEICSNWCWDGSAILNSKIVTVLEKMAANLNERKDYLCIVEAMKQLLRENEKLFYLKKYGININITKDTDLLMASILEMLKSHDKYELNEIIENCTTNSIATKN